MTGGCKQTKVAGRGSNVVRIDVSSYFCISVFFVVTQFDRYY